MGHIQANGVKIVATNKLVLYEILNNSKNSQGEATGMDKPELLKEKLKAALESEVQSVEVVDLSNMRSLSPSFAYEAFGKLYDIFGESVVKRLKFTNDSRDLHKRILSALDRRREVLRLQS